jgi:hypothetical protein
MEGADPPHRCERRRTGTTVVGRMQMQAEQALDDTVSISMTTAEASQLLRELDKWPELPQVERDLVNALKALARTS